VYRLAGDGNEIWVERGAGEPSMIRDDDYVAAGARIAYSKAEVLDRCHLVPKVAIPTPEEAARLTSESTVMAFCHLAVRGRPLVERLLKRRVTMIGYEVIEEDGGGLPVLGAISQIAGQMSISIAANLFRSGAGGRGILLGGSPEVAAAHIVILGAGVMGASAARTALRVGARVTVLDIDRSKLQRLQESLHGAVVALADQEAVAEAVASADVLIGAVLVAGRKAPHIVTRRMVETMQRGSVIIDAAIDQGGCIETSRPMALSDPPYIEHGVIHYAVPNMTADLSRAASMALAQVLTPYLRIIAKQGIDAAMSERPELRRGAYTHAGSCARRSLAEALGLPWNPLAGGGDEERRT
jgi:alanine dehydrogenase